MAFSFGSDEQVLPRAPLCHRGGSEGLEQGEQVCGPQCGGPTGHASHAPELKQAFTGGRRKDSTNRLSLLERSGAGGEILGLAPAEVTIVVAADSGAVTHVIHPSQLPAGCVPTGANNDHFTGAGGEHIERFGEVDTVLTSSHGATTCAWDCADVSRALHSIAKVTGPEHGDGVHEVLFTNRRAVVVPAGFVDKILQRTTPVLEYNRIGNLYLAEVKLSSFTRQGQKR